MATAEQVLRPVNLQMRTPVATWLAREWFFWLVFASWTVLPSTRTPFWSVGGILIKSTDVLLIPLCMLYGLPKLLATTRQMPAGWHRGILWGFSAVASWGIVSTMWSGLDPRGAAAMSYTMLVSMASALFAYLVISSTTDLRGFLWRLVVALTVVCALYTAQSLLGLGLRDPSVGALNDFGMERVRGPLFESSTGFFLLIPAMGFALQEILARRVKPWLGFGCVLCLSITLLGLGSRVGMALFGLFVVSCIWTVKASQRGAVIAILAVVVAGAGYVVFTKANTSRFESNGKDGRTITHETAWEIVKDRGPVELLTGSGMGSWWPWYLTETEGGDLWTSGRHMTRTRYGPLLYHPHSAVLQLVVELGLPGLLFLVALCRACVEAVRNALRCASDTMFSASVAVSLISIGTDFFLFRRPTRDGVWWIFFFGMLGLLAQAATTKMNSRAYISRRSTWPLVRSSRWVFPFLTQKRHCLIAFARSLRSRSTIGNCCW